MSHDQHRGQVVLVTGAARGIGRGIAEAFAAAGAAVVVADLNEEGAEQVAAGLRVEGTEALAVGVDVSSAAGVAEMVRQAVERFGRIDVLVNNAGIYPNTPVLEMDEAEWDAVFDVNVKGMFLVSRDVARTMVPRGGGGRIINISSGAAVSGRIGAAHYCSSKAAVNMLTRVLAIELAPHGINVMRRPAGADRGAERAAHGRVRRRADRDDAAEAEGPAVRHRQRGALPGGPRSRRSSPGRSLASTAAYWRGGRRCR